MKGKEQKGKELEERRRKCRKKRWCKWEGLGTKRSGDRQDSGKAAV